MGLQRRLLDEQIMLKMYIRLAELYGSKAHEYKLKATYEDPIYGRYEMADVKRHVFLIESLNIDIIFTGNHIKIDVELDANTSNLSL